jgi:hypothetical protein
MPTFERSKEIREWIDEALSFGADSPTTVQGWIETHKKGEAPSLATIGRIMRENGYIPVDGVWIRKAQNESKTLWQTVWIPGTGQCVLWRKGFGETSSLAGI